MLRFEYLTIHVSERVRHADYSSKWQQTIVKRTPFRDSFRLADQTRGSRTARITAKHERKISLQKCEPVCSNEDSRMKLNISRGSSFTSKDMV